MADLIRERSHEQNMLVAVDPYGVFPQPLLNQLGDSARVIFLDNETSIRELLEAARSGPSGPSAISALQLSRPVILFQTTSSPYSSRT